MSTRTLTIALSIAACAGCADRPPVKPALTSVDPGAARVLADQLLHLRGENLAPRVQVDFATGRSATVGEYSAHLVAPSGAEIPLGQLALVSRTEATAVVPAASVVAGTTYDVVLADPWGGTSKLERGFRALAACESADGTGPVMGTPCDGPDSDRCLDDVWQCAGETPVCSTGANGCPPHVEVGWFLKPKKSVTDVDPDQVVAHGLLDTPKALILWTGHDSGAGYKTGYHFGAGLTDSSRQSAAVGTLSLDSQASGLAARNMAPSALTDVDYGTGGYIRAQASVAAWDAGSFTLRWDANSEDETFVLYLALSGESVTSKLLSWQMPTSTGSVPVSGAGFQPSLVLHLHAGNQITAPPEMLTSSAFGFGAMTATAQWATSFSSLDGFNPTRTFRVHRPDATVNMVVWNGSALATGKEAAFSSMDADGFTLSFTTLATSYASAARSLALSGLSTSAGCFPKSTATTGLPVPQKVSGLPFRPQAVLFAGTHELSPPAVSSADAVYSFGAFDANTSVATALRDTSALSLSRVDSLSRVGGAAAGAAYVKPRILPSGTLAEATVGSLDPDGFTIAWGLNDGAADEICYVAFGP